MSRRSEASSQVRRLPPDEQRLCVRIARLYYESDLTQERIGDQLGLSRVKVHRMLRLAREVGILEIRIQGGDEATEALGDALVATLGLRDAMVVPDAATADGQIARLAEGAAAWLNSVLRPNMRVGLGLGRTVSRIPDMFRVRCSIDCTFTEIEGAAPDTTAGFAAYNVTSRMAAIAGARAEFVRAPTFVSDRDLRDRLLREPAIAAALDRARQADIILQSVGPVSESALLHIHGVLTAEDLDELRSRGAVGDALGHYFDSSGRHVPFRTDDMHVGLTLEDLTKLPVSALVAGGPEKLMAVRAALRGGYFNVLITDATTAQTLVGEGSFVEEGDRGSG
ncbi:MAG: sugar-binding transcriptional regulator [Acidimicrobiia bacterium]